MCRTNQSVPRNDTHDLDIVFRKTKWRRFGGPAKARPARLCPDSSDSHASDYTRHAGPNPDRPRPVCAGRGATGAPPGRDYE